MFGYHALGISFDSNKGGGGVTSGNQVFISKHAGTQNHSRKCRLAIGNHLLHEQIVEMPASHANQKPADYPILWQFQEYGHLRWLNWWLQVNLSYLRLGVFPERNIAYYKPLTSYRSQETICGRHLSSMVTQGHSFWWPLELTFILIFYWGNPQPPRTPQVKHTNTLSERLFIFLRIKGNNT